MHIYHKLKAIGIDGSLSSLINSVFTDMDIQQYNGKYDFLMKR